ncbi:hypothetical protein NLG97_g368 [Lecanicillium saksenae]|uniref:Uncharacterized protein n=1 Tax=Lecanicillium saksenae TaxID=468837 RepID=A0ACC1R8M4_9HYPO|nr:hypothetical protein NLG97_g368 [Lecanicillium saksenae]
MKKTENRPTIRGPDQIGLAVAPQHVDRIGRHLEKQELTSDLEPNSAESEGHVRSPRQRIAQICLGENQELEPGANPASPFHALQHSTAVRRDSRSRNACSDETQQSATFCNQLTTTARQALLNWQLGTHRPLPRGPSQFSCIAQSIRSQLGLDPVILRWGRCDFISLDVDGILNAVNRDDPLPETRTHSDAKYTVLGFIQPETYYISYRWRENVLQHGKVGQLVHTESSASASATCELLQEVLRLHVPQKREKVSSLGHAGREVGSGFDGLAKVHLPFSSPFWGGWMSYAAVAGDQTASFSFAFVHRSIVIDHVAKTAYVQSLSPADWPWILTTVTILDDIACRSKG